MPGSPRPLRFASLGALFAPHPLPPGHSGRMRSNRFSIRRCWPSTKRRHGIKCIMLSACLS